MIQTYSNAVDQRLSTTGGESPVKISGNMVIDGNQATVTAHFELVDPGSFTAHQATLYIFEHDVNWCCGYGGVDTWNEVVRMVRSTPVSLTTVGQVETVSQTMTIAAGMNPDNLHPAAIYEEISGAKTIIQASDFITLSLDFASRIESVPDGNGTALFSGTVTNLGSTADVATLSVDSGFGWPTDFQVEGDPNYYQTLDVALAEGESKGITVRVQTDGVKRIGTGTFKAESQVTGNTTSTTLRVFNDSYSVLLVNDDNSTGYGTDFSNALTDLGYLFDTVSTAAASAMNGFDAVIWQTAYQTATLDASNIEALSAYLDSGGKLLLSSMDFLTSSPPASFLSDYLGVASFTNTTRALQAVGVPGDPITDGMDMALEWPVSNANRVDTVNPTAGASAIFFSEDGNPAAVRFEGDGGFRTVFNTICQDAFPTSGADPNNSETVIGNSLAWLLQSNPTGMGTEPEASASRILRAGPNPTTGATEVVYSLTPEAARNVNLSMVDAGGRLVRRLYQGTMTPGSHRATWNGADESGNPVAAGVYFVRLETPDGLATGKVVVIR